MAEALGVAEETEFKKTFDQDLEAGDAFDEKLEGENSWAAEAPPFDLSHLPPDTGDSFYGMVVRGEDGFTVVDYLGRGCGSMRAACEAGGGAPIDKVLSLYREALANSSTKREFPNPENPSWKTVHTIRHIGGDVIEIKITREPAEPAKAGSEKKPAVVELSPIAHAENSAAELLWKLAAAPAAETFQQELGHGVEHAEKKVVSAQAGLKISGAAQSGISIEGLPSLAHQTAAEPAQEEPVAREPIHEPTPVNTHAPPAEALRVLQELRRAA